MAAEEREAFTKDPVNQHGYETQRRIGPTRLGVLKNWEWHDDPRRFLFSMARYKFVSKMFDGRRNVLELGCGDAFNAPIVLQTVGRLTVADFDPVFIEDARSRMKEPWIYETKVLDLLDRQMEEVRSNGNFYKQRIEQLQQEPAGLTEIEHRRLELEKEVSAATSELARLRAQAQESAPLRDEQQRLQLRVGELQSVLDQLFGSYDQARHEAVLRETRALEPLALRAERLRAVADRSDEVIAELNPPGPHAADPAIPPGLAALARRGELRLATRRGPGKYPTFKPVRGPHTSADLLNETRGER